MTPRPVAEHALGIVAILVLALLSSVAPLATDMYLPGFPTLSAELMASATATQMTLTGFLLGLAVGQLIIGPLSDRYGRHMPLLIGTALAVVSSLACAVAPNIETLMVLRILQGLGGSAGVVLARAVIIDRTVDATASARLFQIMMIIGGLAPALAPMVGTGIVAFAGWRTVFVVVGLLSLLSFIGIITHIPESLPREKRTGQGMSALWAGMLSVLGNRIYVGYTLTTAFAFMVMFAYIAASPFVFQNVLGLDPVQYALAFGVNAVGMALVSAISAKLVGRFSPRRLAGFGIVLMLASVLAILTSALVGAGAVFMLPAIFATVTSISLILGNASALAIAETPYAAGTASAVMGALQFCLGAIASPLVGIAGKQAVLPMALVMLVASVLAALSSLKVGAARSSASPSSEADEMAA